MKRILYIEANRDGTVGGSYYSLLYLLQRLDKTRYEPHVLFCQDNDLIPAFKKVTPHVYINDFGPSGSPVCRNWIEVAMQPSRLVTEVLLRQIPIRKILRRIKPDLVHLNNGYSVLHEWMLACYLHGIKVLSHDRGTRYPCSLRTRMFVRLLDATISVSESYRNNLIRQNLKVKRIRRVYNGLDVERMAERIDLEAIKSIRSELDLNGGVPVIGIVGNIDRWKGQMVVLQAVKRLKTKCPLIKCLIVGAVNRGAEGYKSELERYVAENGLEGNVVFMGFRQDIANVLSVMDVMVHASIDPEPFGRVILEGMALEKPIVATNAGGPAELITNGEDGLLVPMGDEVSMASAIDEFIGDMERARNMGKKGREKLEKLFSIERMTKETETIYEEIFAEAQEPSKSVAKGVFPMNDK